MSSDSTHGERQKQRDAASYDPVAATFERLSDRFSQPLAERIVAIAQLEEDHQILDVGTGTGIVALEAGRQLSPSGKVLGIDLSEGMLRRAAAKAEAAGLADRVHFEQHDAEALGLESESRDRVLSLFALLHFPDPRAALREMYRVLRPGGMLVLAIGQPPPRRSLEGLAYYGKRLPLLAERLRGRSLLAPDFLDSLVAEMLPAELLRNEPGVDLPASHLQRGTASLVSTIRLAGFERVRTEWDARLGVLESRDEFFDLQATFSSFARDRIATAKERAPERLAALRELFDARCRHARSRGGRLLYPYSAYYAVAYRGDGAR